MTNHARMPAHFMAPLNEVSCYISILGKNAGPQLEVIGRLHQAKQSTSALLAMQCNAGIVVLYCEPLTDRCIHALSQTRKQRFQGRGRDGAEIEELCHCPFFIPISLFLSR